jgi:hypothetical protein
MVTVHVDATASVLVQVVEAVVPEGGARDNE